MRPGDVTDQLLLNPDPDARAETIVFFADMVGALKPGLTHMPLSPHDVAFLRAELQRTQAVAGAVLRALDAAEQLRPAPLQLLEQGDR